MRPQRPTRADHGTVNRYISGCSCLECCDAWNQYQTERKADLKRGVTRLVDVEPVRQHVQRLYRSGISRRALASMAMVSYGSLRLIDGSQKCEGRYTTQVRRETAEALLAVTRAIPGDYSGWVPATRSRELVTRMHRDMTFAQIGKAAGLSGRGVQDVATRNTRVSGRTAKRIDDAAQRLGYTKRTVDREQVMSLVAEGLDDGLVAEIAGCCVRQVIRIRQEVAA